MNLRALRRRLGPADRGSASLQMALAAPLLVVVMLFVVLCGRLVAVQLDLDAAAHSAARAATLARDPGTAAAEAERTAAETLTARSVACPAPEITVDTGSFQAAGSVTVTVTCRVPLSDLGVVGASGSRTVTSSSTSPIDTWRGGS